MEREKFNKARDAWVAELVAVYGEDAGKNLAYSKYGKGLEGSKIRAAHDAKIIAHREYMLSLT